MFRKFRRDVVLPAVVSFDKRSATSPPLPWAWLAANIGTLFPQHAFDVWWQIRVLDRTHPPCQCPWCPGESLTKIHLTAGCLPFARECRDRGIQPGETFLSPSSGPWFVAALQSVCRLAEALRAST